MTTWLKMAEAVEHAKVSQEVIRAAIKAGDLPSYAPTPGGRNILLKSTDIDEWIEGRPYIPKGVA